MNYIIVCPPRSGSTYLGEFLQRSGLGYWNELFTQEITRRRQIWPLDLDEALNDTVVDLAFSRPDSGFKFPYTAAQPGVLTALHRHRSVRVIHILREDLLEQMASWFFLQQCGVSLAKKDGTIWNPAGEQVEAPAAPRLRIAPVDAENHLRGMTFFRQVNWWLFHETHLYHEIHFRDIFTDAGLSGVCDFLGIDFDSSARPDHVPTPRPPARDLIDSFAELSAHFAGTEFEKLFTE